MVDPAVALVCEWPAVAASVGLGCLFLVEVVIVDNSSNARIPVRIDSFLKVERSAGGCGYAKADVVQTVCACNVHLVINAKACCAVRNGEHGIGLVPSTVLIAVREGIFNFYHMVRIRADPYVEFRRGKYGRTLVEILLGTEAQLVIYTLSGNVYVRDLEGSL